MNIAQFLNPFALSEYVEIIVSCLPERLDRSIPQLSRHRLFQHLQGKGECGALGFADQQVDVLRHDDITDEVKAVPAANAFECMDHLIAGVCGTQSRGTMIATERDEVQMPSLLVSFESPGHEIRLQNRKSFNGDE